MIQSVVIDIIKVNHSESLNLTQILKQLRFSVHQFMKIS